MNKVIIIGLILGLVSVHTASQTVFYDASTFPVYGKITGKTNARYERLPSQLEGEIRDRLWYLGTNSAGLYIRFSSNSTSISAKWKLADDVVLNHMTAVGVKGLDLYAYENERWQFVNTGRPHAILNNQTIIQNMDGRMREYMLYLPLYDGLKELAIGVDSLSLIEKPKMEAPQSSKPVVFYGTSITQGACASRPGMAYTAVLGRKLNRQVINLGFSGNGQLDYEIADLMADSDASVFVLDFVPNVNTQQLNDKTEEFVERIRKKHPQTHIVIVGSICFPHSQFDTQIRTVVDEKNKALETICQLIIKKGDRHLSYINPEKLIGIDGEATVDGIHLTDLGFIRYAEFLYPIISKHIKH